VSQWVAGEMKIVKDIKSVTTPQGDALHSVLEVHVPQGPAARVKITKKNAPATHLCWVMATPFVKNVRLVVKM
jgi:hypothetical protein